MNTLWFRGAVTDAHTGVAHMGARDYNPNLAAFTTPDMLVANPDPAVDAALRVSPSTINRMGYVGGDPVNRYDPTGHVPWLLIGLVAGALVGGTLGPLPEPGPGRAAWAALALAIEERADAPPAEPQRELSLLEQRWAELGQPAPIRPDRLITVADNLPLGHLTDAGPDEWNAVLHRATEIHRQQARVQERDYGLSM